MEEVVNLLENFFSKDTRYHSKNEIKKILNLKGEEEENILNAALNELVEKGKLFYDKNGYRIFDSNLGFAFGQLEINKAGTGFVHTSNGYTIIIEAKDLNGALNGDNVIVSNISAKRKDYYDGKIYKITKRETGNVIFEVVGTGATATLTPYNALESVNVNINRNEFKNLIEGDLVLVKVGCESHFGTFDATIKEVLGNKNDPDIDIKLIFAKYDIPVDFNEEVMKEASLLPKTVREEDLIGRTDLRNENIFTIDCDTTKDRDDAVSIKKLENGNYLLKVSIAHVSYYIKANSLLFKEALRRTTSHYPGNTCVPMFPHLISNGICSINPGVDRLTRTVEMEIDNNASIIDYKIYPSVINSKMAMCYSDVNKVLKGEYIKEYSNYIKDLKLMEELNKILEDARERRNYINFNTSEVAPIESKDKIEFKPNNLGLSGQIIENFMLVANTTVYKEFAWHILAYRVHEAPNEERVREVLDILRSSGINLPKIKNINSFTLRNLINNLDDDEISLIVREHLLKSMKKARYDRINIGHFALQYDTYGHFTSPIRRIVDLITHMTIDDIETFNYDNESIHQFEKFIDDACKNANRIEKISKLIEEEVIDMLMAKEMSNHIGEEYEVYVTDINKYSMLVRTKNLIRGKVKLDNMNDDAYYYDQSLNAIIGKKTKKKYQIGNKLYVIVKDASKAARTVNFETAKQKVLSK